MALELLKERGEGQIVEPYASTSFLERLPVAK